MWVAVWNWVGCRRRHVCRTSLIRNRTVRYLHTLIFVFQSTLQAPSSLVCLSWLLTSRVVTRAFGVSVATKPGGCGYEAKEHLLGEMWEHWKYATVCYSVLQCAAVCYIVLQYATVCYSMLQPATVCYSMLHCATVCYSMQSFLIVQQAGRVYGFCSWHTVFTAQWLLYVPHNGYYMYRQFNIHNSTFCPHSVFMCFVWIWEQTAIISLYNINWLVFITEI